MNISKINFNKFITQVTQRKQKRRVIALLQVANRNEEPQLQKDRDVKRRAVEHKELLILKKKEK